MMTGKGITESNRFIERALSTIREFMEDDGQAFVYQKFIAPASAMVSFAKALNRSVIGSMNDLVQASKILLSDDMAPHEVGFLLNETTLSALDYQYPKDAFKSLVDN